MHFYAPRSLAGEILRAVLVLALLAAMFGALEARHAFAAPAITSVSPTGGIVTGGTAITINGSGFVEYSLEGRRVDFALCHPAGKRLVFIEVKQVGQSAGAERQLFEYAFHKGVPLAILSDGQEWHFFLPAAPGEYSERRVYKLDIVEREIKESTGRFEGNLGYADVCSGAALRAA